ncbi:phage major capsid protein (plasmid) [Chromobacterium amazonense]|uniref:phage major capsid protein n=1 Tax=Chromobacterium amazonense TaxID=1382803 RepID=UPI00237D9F4E|nr:phage major capsid protein [Chromobacterium amazonense]MDE1714932.1 phage major capsid protein [Chromobacterium amazonense]
MSKILELKQRRADIAAEVQALATLESGGATLSAEQLQQLDALKAEFGQLGAQLARLEDAERMIAAAAQQVETLNAQGAPPARLPAAPAEPAVKGGSVARMAVALIHAQGNYRMAADYADKHGFGADVAAALNGGSPSAGGVLIPANMATEIIELLRPKAVVRRLGTRSLPLKNGNLTIPRLKGGASVGYIGADNDIPATEQTFDDLKLSAKKMAALVPISNDLLDNAGISPDVEQVVVGDLTSAVGAREDLAFLRGDGSNNTPKGLRGWALPGNCIAAPAPATVDTTFLQAVENFLNALILLLEGVDANMVSPGWVMSPRTFRFLEGLRDGKSNKVYPELAQGQLKGYPVGKTTQIPNNLGKEGDESELYFCDFADCFIGEDKALTIDFSKEATYTANDGKLVSAFSRDQTLVRVIAKHDFGPRHVESVAIGTGVKWGK